MGTIGARDILVALIVAFVIGGGCMYGCEQVPWRLRVHVERKGGG